MLNLLDSPAGTPPAVLRGAIFSVANASWGSDRVLLVSRMVSHASVIPSFAQALSCRHENITHEVALAVRRLVRRYGNTLQLVCDMLAVCVCLAMCVYASVCVCFCVGVVCMRLALSVCLSLCLLSGCLAICLSLSRYGFSRVIVGVGAVVSASSATARNCSQRCNRRFAARNGEAGSVIIRTGSVQRQSVLSN
jgi:hypothetical protein